MRNLTTAFLAVAAMAIAAPGPGRAGDFNHYVLALSWTPGWCEREGAARSAPACAPGAGVGWGVHGLWPQNDDGSWPEYCSTSQRNPSRAETAAQADLFGSGGSAWHQWNKHGRCSGLSAADYFALTRQAAALPDLPPLTGQPRIRPQTLQAKILTRNPAFAPKDMVITCSAGMIAEIRLCLTRDLTPRPCDAQLAARACRSRSVQIPPPR